MGPFETLMAHIRSFDSTSRLPELIGLENYELRKGRRNKESIMGVESESAQAGPSSDQIEELLEAARYDEIEDIVSLVSMGVPLDSKDSQGRTALHMAAANGHLTIVDYLIKNGADANVTNLEKNTPLHWACLNGHIEVIKALILAGASVSVLNSHEKTPVDEAVTGGKMEVLDAINAAVAQAELDGISVS